MKVIHVVGARPNFMKIAPVMRAMDRGEGLFEQVLIHTGQHYDPNMSQVFFDELALPRPDRNLGVGSGSHAWQTGEVMARFEPVVLDLQPDWVVVVGDVNSTLACTLVCSKLGVPVAHVEAGLRSFDRTMPEEINRLVTDQLADLLFTHSAQADENLRREGVAAEKIHFVGNVMIDTLVDLFPRAEARWPQLQSQHGLANYILVTLHRPSNVDDPQILAGILEALTTISRQVAVLFPVHPRTRKAITAYGLQPASGDLRLIEPLSYLDFVALEAHAALVLTDSGGVQEETTFLGVPCLTARPNTERPITITAGTNELVASEREVLLEAMQRRLGEPRRAAAPPPLWDGHAAERIVEVFASLT